MRIKNETSCQRQGPLITGQTTGRYRRIKKGKVILVPCNILKWHFVASSSYQVRFKNPFCWLNWQEWVKVMMKAWIKKWIELEIYLYTTADISKERFKSKVFTSDNATILPRKLIPLNILLNTHTRQYGTCMATQWRLKCDLHSHQYYSNNDAWALLRLTKCG